MPFLSFFATRAVAHFFRSRLVAALDDGADVLVLGAGLLERADPAEPLVLAELVDVVSLLGGRSSPRFSSLRRSSSPRERLLRQSPRLRSPKRLRERSPSRLPLSDRELPLGGWAQADLLASEPSTAAETTQAKSTDSNKCKRRRIEVSTVPAFGCFATRRSIVYCCHCIQVRLPLCGQWPTNEN